MFPLNSFVPPTFAPHVTSSSNSPLTRAPAANPKDRQPPIKSNTPPCCLTIGPGVCNTCHSHVEDKLTICRFCFSRLENTVPKSEKPILHYCAKFHVDMFPTSNESLPLFSRRCFVRYDQKTCEQGKAGVWMRGAGRVCERCGWRILREREGRGDGAVRCVSCRMVPGREGKAASLFGIFAREGRAYSNDKR